MDELMTMNRAIHAAVLRDLDRVESGLRGMADGDSGRAGEICRTWDHFRKMLTHHHEGEDELIWPFLASVGVESDLLGAMESEHQNLALALAAGGEAIDAVRRSAAASDAAHAADTIARARGVIKDHLTHEEADVESLLRVHVESPEWKAVEKQLRGRMGPVESGWFFAWLQDDAPPEVMTFLRGAIPPPVLFLLGRVFGRGYHRSIGSAWS
jgi:hemerythrin-like domain-containing protein